MSKLEKEVPQESTDAKSPLTSRSGWALAYVALAAFLATPTAYANTENSATTGSDDSAVAKRIEAAKNALIKAQPADSPSFNVAQWLNVGFPWGNWHNWPNWHNWGNHHWGPGGWFNL